MKAGGSQEDLWVEVGFWEMEWELGAPCSDPERKRRGRKTLGSAGDGEAVGTPLAS